MSRICQELSIQTSCWISSLPYQNRHTIMSTNNLNFPQHNIPLYENNGACIKIAIQESIKHNKTKHVENKIHYINFIQNNIVDIIKINTQIQLADVFTKALGKDIFLRHRDVLLDTTFSSTP